MYAWLSSLVALLYTLCSIVAVFVCFRRNRAILWSASHLLQLVVAFFLPIIYLLYVKAVDGTVKGYLR